uniref:Uncharacterized protein n=1 Tax=Anguilla anguilla TaxID=7936 RepID=A0A0E9SZK4_ANGAN
MAQNCPTDYLCQRLALPESTGSTQLPIPHCSTECPMPQYLI